MTEEEEIRREIRRAYQCGVQEARASFASDLRMLADDFTSQVFELRQEVRQVLGLPPLAGPEGDRRDGTLQ